MTVENRTSLDNDSDDNAFVDNEEEIDDATHKRLVKNVLSLNKKQHIQKPSRTEPTLEVSEFNLVKSITGAKGAVHLSDLTKVLKQKAKHTDIGKKVKSSERKAKTLPKPLEKPQAERIRRSVAYENIKNDLDKWDAVVTSNRAANTLHFPFNFDNKLEEKVLSHMPYRVKSDLQKKLDELEPKVEVYNVDMALEEKHPLSMEEIMTKRKEAAKVRAHQSYKEAKARRQNKIKSKKYHRIQRKEKIKQQMQEFEILQKTNPEAALLKLEEIERVRAEERMSLRHKSTGQWAKNKQVRAKYDKESRQALAQQLTISKELTQKLKTNDSSDSEPEENLEQSKLNGSTEENNPWAKIKTSKEIDDFVSGYRKYWEDKNKINNDGIIIKEESMDEKKTDKSPEINSSVNGVNKIKDENKESNQGKQCQNKQLFGAENVEAKVDAADLSLNKNNAKAVKSKKRKTSCLNVSSTSDWEVTPVKVAKRSISQHVNTDDEESNEDDLIEKMLNKMEANESKLIKSKLCKVKKEMALLSKADGSKSKRRRKAKKVKKINLDLNVEAKRPNIDEALIEDILDGDENTERKENILKLQSILNSTKEESTEKSVKPKVIEKSIDPNKIGNLKPTPLEAELPDLTSYEENEEEGISQGMLVDAFEDEEIIDEFKKDKDEEIEKDKPKDIDLTLPGWGSWGGLDVKEPKRKKRRFIIKMPKNVPRRDDNKGDLVINENADVPLKGHLVSELPFPFKSVKDYEASIRAPIGNTFVPETAFRKLTKPAVTTEMGAIIEPMTDEILIKKMRK